MANVPFGPMLLAGVIGGISVAAAQKLLDEVIVPVELPNRDARKLTQILDHTIYTQDTLNGVAGPHLVFRGLNLHLQDGSGQTGSPSNGLGNLFLGYDELAGLTVEAARRGGSHNLVIGAGHEFDAHSGLVAGEKNKALGAAVTALGLKNEAGGDWAFVAGGSNNEAAGVWSVSLGGVNNVAGSDEGTGVILGAAQGVADQGCVLVGGVDNVGSSPGLILGGRKNCIPSGFNGPIGPAGTIVGSAFATLPLDPVVPPGFHTMPAVVGTIGATWTAKVPSTVTQSCVTDPTHLLQQ